MRWQRAKRFNKEDSNIKEPEHGRTQARSIMEPWLLHRPLPAHATTRINPTHPDKASLLQRAPNLNEGHGH
jgi:hypothetical protein